MIGNFGGVFTGTTLLQEHGAIGGARSVFVKLFGTKDELVYPTHGGYLKNAFKQGGKIFAGDLFEYRTDDKGENPVLFLLKTFEVVSASGSTVKVVRDGYHHVPSVGDVLMVAPSTLDGTGTAVTVNAVVANGEVYDLTLSGALSASEGDVLVEAEAEGTSKMLVQNPNTFAPNDYDVLHAPAADENSFDGARYFLTPVLHAVAYKCKMSVLPACVETLNKSRVNGWFEL